MSFGAMTHNDSTIPASPLYVKYQMEVLVLVKAIWDHRKTYSYKPVSGGLLPSLTPLSTPLARVSTSNTDLGRLTWPLRS
jgi:hypothetical protein